MLRLVAKARLSLRLLLVARVVKASRGEVIWHDMVRESTSINLRIILLLTEIVQNAFILAFDHTFVTMRAVVSSSYRDLH